MSVSDLVEIEALSNIPPWGEKQFELEFQHLHSYIFGARVGGAVVGFLVAHLVVDEAHIVNFAIHPDARGKGVGRSLLDYALVDLWERGARWVTLEVRKSNDVAKELYSSAGFSELDIRKSYYSNDGEDALVLGLNLRNYIHAKQSEDQADLVCTNS